MPLIRYAHPVDACYGIFFGAAAYCINHHISKTKRLSLPTKLCLNLCIGLIAVALWCKVCLALNGPPPGWHELTLLPLWGK